MEILFTLIVALSVGYGLYMAYGLLRPHLKKAGLVAAGVLVTAAAMAPSGFTSAQESPGVVLDFNLDPFFAALNQYLPIFIGLFAIIGGIAGAMALARYVIGAVVRAFSGTGNI